MSLKSQEQVEDKDRDRARSRNRDKCLGKGPKPNSKHIELDFFDFAQTYANFLPIVGVLKRPKKFFLPTLLWGDTAQNVVFGVKIRVQRNGHNFLWLKAFSIIFSTSVRG